MKIRFYCYQPVGSDGTVMNVSRNAILLDAPTETINTYNKYLLSALSTDFPSYFPKFSEEVIEAIKPIDQGWATEYTWEGDGFTHTITRDKVTFEHTIFSECPEWPIWSCPLSHYKAALLGWRQFIEMTEAIDTELFIELPDIC